MTENEAMDLDRLIEDAKVLAKKQDTLARTFRGFKDYGNPKSTITRGAEKAQKESEQYEHISKLFEELKQYRAIGTVEQLEWCKDASHWKELFKEKLEQYESIGTIDEFKALKEKNTPKKVAYQGEHEKCPNCGSFHVFGKHCTECGQVVDYD